MQNSRVTETVQTDTELTFHSSHKLFPMVLVPGTQCRALHVQFSPTTC